MTTKLLCQNTIMSVGDGDCDGDGEDDDDGGD